MATAEFRQLPIHDVPETVAHFSRSLPDGQTLEYRLQVLQQPQRARACGQGAKSHADRRPVDPPPVVELRLFQGTGDNKQDVTFSYAANFFLYATLELARPIAQGRGMGSAPTSSPPVLTGVPVSGMAYLDRPSPAGYFIFPDLSVRHEGIYRLRFSLYEHINEPVYPAPEDPHDPKEFTSRRVDVKSEPFQVYSAKRFPGLKESTALSRYMAEQGCRVRIRRDVRMRRRSDRHCSEELDETAALRAVRGQSCDQYDVEHHIKQQQAQHVPPPSSPYTQPSPPPYMERAGSVDRKRSSSDVSLNSIQEPPRLQPYNNGYSAPAQNHGPYGPPSTTPHPPSFASHYSQHLTFGSYNAIPAPPPPSLNSQPPPQAYQHTKRLTYNQAQSAPCQAPSMQQPLPQQRRDSTSDYRRRDSTSSYHAPPPPHRPVTPSYHQPSYNAPQAPSYNSYPPPQYHSSTNSLPPLRIPALLTEPKPYQPTTPSSTTPTPPTPSAYNKPPQRPACHIPQPSPHQFPNYYPDANAYSARQQTLPPTTTESRKRPWGRVFNTAHIEGPLMQGARPTDDGEVYGADPYTNPEPGYESNVEDAVLSAAGEEDSEDGGLGVSEGELAKLGMSYRRADGVEINRRLPGYAPA